MQSHLIFERFEESRKALGEEQPNDAIDLMSVAVHLENIVVLSYLACLQVLTCAQDGRILHSQRYHTNYSCLQRFLRARGKDAGAEALRTV